MLIMAVIIWELHIVLTENDKAHWRKHKCHPGEEEGKMVQKL